jgi:hypothetical protein
VTVDVAGVVVVVVEEEVKVEVKDEEKDEEEAFEAELEEKVLVVVTRPELQVELMAAPVYSHETGT